MFKNGISVLISISFIISPSHPNLPVAPRTIRTSTIIKTARAPKIIRKKKKRSGKSKNKGQPKSKNIPEKIKKKIGKVTLNTRKTIGNTSIGTSKAGTTIAKKKPVFGKKFQRISNGNERSQNGKNKRFGIHATGQVNQLNGQ